MRDPKVRSLKHLRHGVMLRRGSTTPVDRADEAIDALSAAIKALQTNVLRERMLEWIATQRDSNRDLFYYKRPKGVAEGAINTGTSGNRWPKDFDFGTLDDESLFDEFIIWMFRSTRLR